MATEHPRPWWFRLALRWCPARCREIPEAVNPDRIVLRQVALWKRHLYLQQFSGSEDPSWMHSHQWRWTLAVGLWGAYVERRLGQQARIRRAPYCYAMSHEVVHRVSLPSPGHTSLFLGLWRDDDLKHYYPTFQQVGLDGGLLGLEWERQHSRAWRKPWEAHVQKMVARI